MTEPRSSDSGIYWKQDTSEGSILVLRFERPPANGLDHESLRELAKLLDRTEREAALRCLVVASGVAGYFIGDTDDSEWERIASSDSPQAELIPWHRACSRLASYPLPTIAAIDGTVAGAGIDLALCADLRVAGPSALFDFSLYTARSTIHYSGGTQRLPRLVGKARALEMVLAGDRLGPGDAYACGLVEKLAKNSALEEALALARAIATLDREVVVAAKTAISSSEVPMAEGLALESRLAASLIATSARTRANGGEKGSVDTGVGDPPA